MDAVKQESPDSVVPEGHEHLYVDPSTTGTLPFAHVMHRDKSIEG